MGAARLREKAVIVVVGAHEQHVHRRPLRCEQRACRCRHHVHWRAQQRAPVGAAAPTPLPWVAWALLARNAHIGGPVPVAHPKSGLACRARKQQTHLRRPPRVLTRRMRADPAKPANVVPAARLALEGRCQWVRAVVVWQPLRRGTAEQKAREADGLAALRQHHHLERRCGCRVSVSGRARNFHPPSIPK